MGCIIGGDDDDSGGGGGGKPTDLSSNASYDQALAKVDEIIAYCEKFPAGSVNASVRLRAEILRTNMIMPHFNLRNNWNSAGGQWISDINTIISNLQ